MSLHARPTLLGLTLAAALLAGCGDSPGDDAGPGDAGAPRDSGMGERDSGGEDAGPALDAGETPDGGAIDGGAIDGGATDGGGSDGGGTDAGRPDGGRPDAGRPDAGGPADCGSLGAACNSAGDCDPGQMCEAFGSGGRSLCVPDNRLCGGFVGAMCPTTQPNCLMGGFASAWPCATNPELRCICMTMAGRAAYPTLCPPLP